MTEELKPCPFCGGKAVVVKSLVPWISCTGDCQSGFIGYQRVSDNGESVSKWWNTRVKPNQDKE